MVRTQIQLSEKQIEALRELAAQRDTSMADIIRQAVDQLILATGAVNRAERKRRAIAAAGRFKSDVNDLSTNHDQYLAEAFEA
jgi:predicted transcriptional regulator